MAGYKYRTDWMDPTDPHQNRVDVSYHDGDLTAAKAMARKMSKKTGSAYVVKYNDWTDLAQLGYTDGRKDGGWDS